MSGRNTLKRRVIAYGAAVGGVTLLVACASLGGIDQLAVGPCKGGEPCDEQEASTRDRNGGNDEDTGGGVEFSCPASAPGPKMVQVGTPTNQFCIDSTEVTFGQYKAFLASNPATADQPSVCSWNTSFTPPSDAGTFTDDMPAVWVDWCDAVAYCSWAGKRLCGKIVNGKDPGTSLSQSDLTQPTDEWYTACSDNGQKPYPYGTTMKPGACNLFTGKLTGTKSAGSYPNCVGGSEGIFDMVGNVWEWIDLCVDADAGGGPENFVCYSRGGSFGTAEIDAKCSFNGTLARRKAQSDQIGFRCCSP